MVLNPETFASYLRDLISHLESKNVGQAETHIGVAIEFLGAIHAAPANSTIFDPHKVQVTLIALGAVRSAVGSGQLRAALSNAKEALDEWESKPS
jgi:hypothetical protein